MPAQPRRFQVDEVGYRAQCSHHAVPADGADRCRFRVQHGGTWVVTQVGQPTLAAPEDDIDDIRVVGVTTSATDDRTRARPSDAPRPHLHIASDRHHPDRNRHVVAREAIRVTPAIPALVRMCQRLGDGRTQPQPGRQPRAHLAVLGEASPPRTWIRQRRDHPAGATHHRQFLTEVAHVEPNLLGRLGHQHRRHHRVERDVVAAGEHRRIRRIRRAPQEPQQRHVVDARLARRVQPQLLRRPQ